MFWQSLRFAGSGDTMSGLSDPIVVTEGGGERLSDVARELVVIS